MSTFLHAVKARLDEARKALLAAAAPIVADLIVDLADELWKVLVGSAVLGAAVWRLPNSEAKR